MAQMRDTFARLHPLQRAAVVVWALLLLGVAGRVLVAPVRSHTVVPIYLTAAERWVNGENLYAPAPPLDVYRNPPGIAAVFVPLTWVPERAAGLIWRGLSAAVFLLGLAAWVRHGLSRPLTPGESGAVFLLAVLPAVPSLNNGQTNLLIIGALLFGATAAARAHGFAAGSWLAVAAAVKVYPLAGGLLVAAGSPRRVLPWLLAGCAALSAAPFLLQDPAYVLAEHRHFRESVTADDRTLADLRRAPRDLFLVLRVWVAPPRPEVYLAVKLAAAAGMAGLVVLAARGTGNPRVVAPLALHLGCAWMTVLGPATEVHTYAILGPTAAAVLVFAAADRGTTGGRVRFGLAAAGYVLLVAPIVRDMFPNGGPFHALGVQPVGGLLVLAAAAWAGVRLAVTTRTTRPAPVTVHAARLNLPDGERSDGCRTAPASPVCERT